MAEKDTFSVRYDYDDMLGPMEPPLMDQMGDIIFDKPIGADRNR